MQEMQDLNTRNYAIPTMLIDDDIIDKLNKSKRQMWPFLEHKLDEMNKIKDHLQINRFEPQLFACSTFSFGRLCLSEYKSDDTQVNGLIKLSVSCSPSDKWTLFVSR